MPHLAHFAINADDVERAKTFYERVFGWTFSAWGPPRFYQIETGPAAQPVRAALQGRRTFEGHAPIGYECTISVPSIDDTAKRVVDAGGAVVLPKSVIVGVGALMFFKDTEGNVFGAIQFDERAE
ncbi:MAG TPA: VOC family protein [Vicinamibacterales bacterium]|nr:VOC family protein [Vicinamibacterales bacterium]